MANENPPLPPGMVIPPPLETPKPEAIPSAPTSTSAIPAGAIKVEPVPMPPIVLNPPKEPKPISGAQVAKKDAEHKDTIRELMETVVFVVVLVLMLKTFLAEAFVIPTGSMAGTLLGYHYKRPCDQCGYPNLVNASSEAEPQQGDRGFPVVSCQCQNCGWTNPIRGVPQIPQGVQP